MLDLAHASERTGRDVLAEELPFSVTHAGCRSVCDHPRNLADWQLQALAERGGVLGMMAIPFAVDPEAPTLRRWLDHFDRAVAVMGVARQSSDAPAGSAVSRPTGPCTRSRSR